MTTKLPHLLAQITHQESKTQIINTKQSHLLAINTISEAQTKERESNERHRDRKQPEYTQSVSTEPQANNRLLIRIASPRRIPSHVLDCLLQHILVRAVDLQALVPLAASSADDLEALVLLGRCVGAAETLEQLRHGGVARDVCCLEGDLCRGRELPWRSVCLEDVGFCVLCGEEVVVARLAARAAGRVRHLGGRHGGIDVGIWLRLAREHVARAVGLVGIGLLRIIAGRRPLSGSVAGSGH